MKTGEKDPIDENKVGKDAADGVSKMVSVTFKENRKYDLHIGRNVITFMARQTKDINEKFLDHPDWGQAKDLFIINKKEDVKEK